MLKRHASRVCLITLILSSFGSSYANAGFICRDLCKGCNDPVVAAMTLGGVCVATFICSKTCQRAVDTDDCSKC